LNKNIQIKNDVHFTEEGYKVLAKKVADEILFALNYKKEILQK